MIDLLDEIDRLRAEEDAEGREIGQLHDALEAYRNKLAIARAALEDIEERCYNSRADISTRARKVLEEIK